MRIDEIVDEAYGKAGFIPYVYEDGFPVFMFMIPSDVRFGGPQPGIAKGGIDAGETVYEAALREAGEELGLKKGNIKKSTVKKAWSGKLTGLDETYNMTVYIGEVKDKADFKEPHWETGEVRWMTKDQFMKAGRDSQRHIIRACAALIDGEK